jgi:hypothetical protein
MPSNWIGCYCKHMDCGECDTYNNIISSIICKYQLKHTGYMRWARFSVHIKLMFEFIPSYRGQRNSILYMIITYMVVDEKRVLSGTKPVKRRCQWELLFNSREAWQMATPPFTRLHENSTATPIDSTLCLASCYLELFFHYHYVPFLYYAPPPPWLASLPHCNSPSPFAQIHFLPPP